MPPLNRRAPREMVEQLIFWCDHCHKRFQKTLKPSEIHLVQCPTSCGNPVKEVTEEWMSYRAKRLREKEDRLRQAQMERENKLSSIKDSSVRDFIRSVNSI